MKLSQLQYFVLGAVLTATMLCSGRLADAAAVSRLWTRTTDGGSWTSGTSWASSIEPGPTEVAQFATDPSVGPLFNVGVSNLNPSVGAVEVTSARTTTLLITNLGASGASGKLTLNGALVNTTVGGGVDTANVIIHHAGSATLTFQDGTSPRPLTLDLPNNLSGGNVVAIDGAGKVAVKSAVSGIGGITLRGNSDAAILELGGPIASTYVGDTIVSRGQILANTNAPNGTAGALGNSSSAVIVGDANTLTGEAFLMAGGAVTIGRQVLITNNGTGLAGIGANTNSNSTFSGAVTFNRDMVIGQFGTTGTLSITGGLAAGTAGAKTITFGKTGFQGAVTVSTTGITDGLGTVAVNLATISSRTVLFSATNDYSGDTTITTGRLRAQGGNAIPNGEDKGNLILNGGTQFGIVNNETVNGLSGSGIVDNDANAAVTFTVGDNNATGAFNTFNGTIKNSGGNINSILNLSKLGNGILTLAGNNTYVGTTTVTDGTLLVNGTHSGVHAVAPDVADAYTVASGGTLGGDGIIEAIVNLSGTISPGDSLSAPGTLKINDLVVSGTVTGLYDLDALGGTSDLVELTGLLDLTANPNVTIDVNVLNGAYLNDGIYNLVHYNDIVLPSGGGFTYNGPLNALQTATIGLSSLDGEGFVYLQLQTVPEPGSIVLAIMGMIGLGWIVRKKR